MNSNQHRFHPWRRVESVCNDAMQTPTPQKIQNQNKIHIFQRQKKITKASEDNVYRERNNDFEQTHVYKSSSNCYLFTTRQIANILPRFLWRSNTIKRNKIIISMWKTISSLSWTMLPEYNTFAKWIESINQFKFCITIDEIDHHYSFIHFEKRNNETKTNPPRVIIWYISLSRIVIMP